MKRVWKGGAFVALLLTSLSLSSLISEGVASSGEANTVSPAGSDGLSTGSAAVFLEHIKTLQSTVSDLSCTVVERFETASGAVSQKEISVLQVKPPLKRRKLKNRQGEYDRLEIEVGSESWSMTHPKSVSHVTWEQPVAFISTPLIILNPVSTKHPRRGAWYVGSQEMCGEPCYHFEDSSQEYWISVRDGLLRRKVQKPMARDASGTRFIQEFREVVVNQGISDALFQLELRPGTQVSEKVFQPGGRSIESSRVIPYPESRAGTEERTLTEERMTEIRSAFERTSAFSCAIAWTETMHGTKIGPRPDQFPQGRAPSPSERPDLYKTMMTSATGTLLFQRPGRIDHRYEQESNSLGTLKDGLFITDGVDQWFRRGTVEMAGRQAREGCVTKESVAGKKRMLKGIMTGIGKAKILEERFRSGTPSSPIHPPRLEALEFLPYEVRLPGLLFAPFNGIPTQNLMFEREETLDKEPVYRFVAGESPANRRLSLVIGKNDGVVRRLEEYDWLGEKVEFELRVSRVSVNPVLASDAFRFKDDGSTPVQDMDTILASSAEMMKKACDVPPEETFKNFFSSPASSVSELAGGGMAMMGVDVYIRFRCNEKPVLVDEAAFVGSDPASSAAWFSKAFPENAPDLATSGDLRFLKKTLNSSGGSGESHLLIHPNRNLYFFRSWYSH